MIELYIALILNYLRKKKNNNQLIIKKKVFPRRRWHLLYFKVLTQQCVTTNWISTGFEMNTFETKARHLVNLTSKNPFCEVLETQTTNNKHFFQMHLERILPVGTHLSSKPPAAIVFFFFS